MTDLNPLIGRLFIFVALLFPVALATMPHI